MKYQLPTKMAATLLLAAILGFGGLAACFVRAGESVVPPELSSGVPLKRMSSDTAPERRAAAIANVKAWWAVSQNATPAQMIRNQLALWDTNPALSLYERVEALSRLVQLEGINAALDEINKLSDEPPKESWLWFYEVGIPRLEVLYKADERMRTKWSKEWNVALFADLLDFDTIDRKRTLRDAGEQAYSLADKAMEQFLKHVENKFGYQAAENAEKRREIIVKTREWWWKEGRDEFVRALFNKYKADFKDYTSPGDFFLSKAEIDASVSALTGADAAQRRKTVHALGRVCRRRIVQALLSALKGVDERPQKG